ncbi:MAG: hypothetical protein WCP32_09280 [Bacteroidota bacterium]
MKTIIGKERMKISIFVYFVLIIMLSIQISESRAQKIKVDNIGYELKDDNIQIHYDLIGEPAKNYKVSVVLKREQSPGFMFKPKSLVGDIGKGKFAGTDRRIIWNFINEFKPEEGVTDYYFEVTAKKPGKAWIYILGGGILAGGATAAVILLSGKKDEADPKIFPQPIRPSSR